jgi:16S rRNA (cytidine1402-2'-O)-methyltransferase
MHGDAGAGAVSAPAGTLYLVATPIGNLEDMTLRAIRVLREAAVVACEDTRRTRGLLAHLDIHTPTVSLHEHNEVARIPEILGMLREGKSVAVTSDAGTPAVSDPGAVLVAAAASAGFRVEPIPGPSAVTAAMSVAGFPAGTFAFFGFPPRRRSQRVRFLSALSALPVAVDVRAAPRARHPARISKRSLRVDGCWARELTKVHEEILRGTPPR